MGKNAKKTGTDVAVRSGTGVAQANLPTFLANYKGPLGTEGIDAKDVTIPRLKIGQAMSQEVKDKVVPEGALFINITGEVVWKPGDAPLPFLIVARGKEFILWRPREDNGGGILARAKPVTEKGVTRFQWDKPNSSFDVKVGGKVKATWKTKKFIDEDGLDQWGSELPGDEESGIAATAHHNFLVMLPTKGGIVVAVSMSRAGVKKAKDLNGAIKWGDVRFPLPTRKFVMSTLDEKSDKGDYKNWNIKPDGYLGEDEADLARTAMGYFQGFQTTGYTVDQSDDEADAGGEERGKKGAGDNGRV